MSELFDPYSLRQELTTLKPIVGIESASHPDGLFSFRCKLKDYGEIPPEFNERVPTNCWIFLIDVTNYKTGNWARYSRVGQFLFNWNIGHWRRINGGIPPTMHHDTKEYDFPGLQWVYENGEWKEEVR